MSYNPILNPQPVTSSNTPLATVTGTVTTSTSSVVAGSGSAIAQAGSVTIYISGTYAGVNVTFEQSPDGTNWYATQGQRADTGVLTTNGATGVLTTNSSVAYDVTPLLGPTQFRVRATAWTSGTANVVIAPAIRAVEISPTLAAGSNAIGSVSVSSGTITTVSTVTNPVTVKPSLPVQVFNHTTTNTTQVQLTATSYAPTNGVLIQALSTNTASVFIGLTGVTTSTGFELVAGQSITVTPTNANLIYIIGANTSDKVCWLVG